MKNEKKIAKMCEECIDIDACTWRPRHNHDSHIFDAVMSAWLELTYRADEEYAMRYLYRGFTKIREIELKKFKQDLKKELQTDYTLEQLHKWLCADKVHLIFLGRAMKFKCENATELVQTAQGIAIEEAYKKAIEVVENAR